MMVIITTVIIIMKLGSWSAGRMIMQSWCNNNNNNKCAKGRIRNMHMLKA